MRAVLDGSPRLWRLAFAAAVLANLALLFWPRTVSAGGPPHLDKLVHLASFALVAGTGLRARVPARVLVPVLAGHAVVSEVVQATLLARRSGDLADVVADLLGVLVGWLLARASWTGEHAGAAGRVGRSGRPPAGRDPGAG